MPSVVVLLGEGPAATYEYTAPLLGTYRKSTEMFNSKPVYQLDGRNFYLFYDTVGYWRIDNDVNDHESRYYHIRSKKLNLLSPPSNEWQYCTIDQCETASSDWRDDEHLLLLESGNKVSCPRFGTRSGKAC